ncbi:MAG TPA: hypothetical protein PLD59_01935 [Tepidisphaeraceae bacterium]|nr:hypothetical protein [Tepidisphaeraceae bacterium]
MGVYEARGSLAKAMKDLTTRWNDIRVQWSDPRAEEIERDLLQPMEMDARFAENAMDQLANLLSAARRDCE